MEIPFYNKCCFCLPLRRGLILWGYVKLLLSSIIIISLTLRVVETNETDEDSLKFQSNMVIIYVALCMTSTDVIMTVMFIVGCHKRHTYLLKTYYFYSLFILALLACMWLYNMVLTMYYMHVYAKDLTFKVFLYEIIDSLALLANIALQGYLILLTRSSIIKINNEYQLRFVNNAVGARCSIDMDDTTF